MPIGQIRSALSRQLTAEHEHLCCICMFAHRIASRSISIIIITYVTGRRTDTGIRKRGHKLTIDNLLILFTSCSLALALHCDYTSRKANTETAQKKPNDKSQMKNECLNVQVRILRNILFVYLIIEQPK